MLLDPLTWMPASRSEEALAVLAPTVAGHTSAETHGSAVELATDPHATVSAAVDQLTDLRQGLADALGKLGMAGAVAGTHPLATWEDTQVSPGARYQFLYASMRELARREPTFALHVHVAVPDEVSAIRAYNGLREHLPLLLALSANSPFWQGRDSGLAAARIPIFHAFPRTGTPRRFETYDDYVEAVDVLLRCDAIPEPTFLWWDVRLQPRLGTIEVRVMDAQTRVRGHRRRSPRSCSASCGARRSRAPTSSSPPRPRSWRRTASWPRATASRRSSWCPARAAACRSATCCRRSCARARPTPSGCAACPSWSAPTPSPSTPARPASARSPCARRACAACCARCTWTSRRRTPSPREPVGV